MAHTLPVHTWPSALITSLAPLYTCPPSLPIPPQARVQPHQPSQPTPLGTDSHGLSPHSHTHLLAASLAAQPSAPPQARPHQHCIARPCPWGLVQLPVSWQPGSAMVQQQLRLDLQASSSRRQAADHKPCCSCSGVRRAACSLQHLQRNRPLRRAWPLPSRLPCPLLRCWDAWPSTTTLQVASRRESRDAVAVEVPAQARAASGECCTAGVRVFGWRHRVPSLRCKGQRFLARCVALQIARR
jgi:hypothetical protein